MSQTTCPQCGGANQPGLAFCTHCGTPTGTVGPAPPPLASHEPAHETVRIPSRQAGYLPPGPAATPGYAVAPAAVPPSRRPRRTDLVVMWVVLALLVVGAGITGGVLLLDREPEQSPTVAGPSDRDRESGESRPTDPATSPAPAPSPVQCWNGPRPSLADCTPPTGRRGIRWVFPSMKDDLCTRGRAIRKQIWNCYDNLADGTVIRFNYSEWDSVAPAVEHYSDPPYRGEFSETRMPDGRLRWFSYDLDKSQYKAAFVYQRAPWSVTIYTDTKEQRAEAIRDLLEMRPFGELRGVG